MKNLNLLFINIIILLIAAGLNAGEDISLSAGLNRTDIAYEDTVELNLQIKWTGDIQSYAFEVLPLPDLENLKVLGTSSAISSSQEGGTDVTTRTFKYTLQPTMPGVGVIKPINLQCISMPDSIPHQLTTQEMTVKIAAPIPKKEQSGPPFYVYIIIILVIAGAAVTLFLIIRKKPETEPVRSPEEVVIGELAAIKNEGYADRKLFFTRLFKLLVGYLEHKYNRKLSGLTAEKIVAELENIDLSPNGKEKFTEWLTKAEKEKFAPMGGEPGDILRLITELENFFNNMITK